MALRSRKVDFKRRFQVLRFSEALDLDETVSLGRGVPAIKTGVDKEEEDEHHLRAALNANQAGIEKQSVFIPTPDASRPFNEYEFYYKHDYLIPKALVKFSANMDDYLGCPYNLDEVDDAFLAEWRAEMLKDGGAGRVEDVVPDEDAFEMFMFAFEAFGSLRLGPELPTVDQAIIYFSTNEPNLLIQQPTFGTLFSHWSHRRYTATRPKVTSTLPGRSIAPPLRVDDLSNNAKQDDSDPYICFRKRDLRPQRKHTRKSGLHADVASLEKLKRLHADLVTVRSLLDQVGAREETRRELLAMDTAFFEKRCLVRKLKRTFGMADGDENKKKRKKVDDARPTSLKIKLRHPIQDTGELVKSPLEPETEDSRIAEQLKKRKCEDEAAGYVDWTEILPSPPTQLPGASYWKTSIPASIPSSASAPAATAAPPTFPARLPYARCRLGRGGRVLFDRRFDPHRCPSALNDTRFRAAAQAWNWDTRESEFSDTVWEMEDTLRNMAYRAFHLTPTQSDEINHFLSKPTYPEQINPKPNSDPLTGRVPLPAYEVVRVGPATAIPAPPTAVDASAPASTSAAAAPARKKKETEKKSNKKPPPVLDERAQKVKSMLDNSKAAAQAAQLLKQQAVGGAAGGSTSAAAPGTPSAANATPTANGTVPQSPAPSALNGLPVAANGAASSPQAQLQLQQMAQQQLMMRQQQAAAMLAAGNGGVGGAGGQPGQAQMPPQIVNSMIHQFRYLAQANGGQLTPVQQQQYTKLMHFQAIQQQRMAQAAAMMGGGQTLPNGVVLTPVQQQQIFLLQYQMMMKQKQAQMQAAAAQAAQGGGENGGAPPGAAGGGGEMGGGGGGGGEAVGV